MADPRLTPAQAAEYLGVTVQAIYVLNSRKENDFPRPSYTGRTPTWSQSELDVWRAAHPPKRSARQRRTAEGTDRDRGNADFHDLRAHLAFMTARDGPALTDDLRSLIERTMRDAARSLKSEVEGIRCKANYVHLVVRYPVDTSVASLAQRLRGASTRALRQSHTIDGHLWSKPYYVASAAAHSTARLSRYVECLEQTINN
ncbi:IS200/IS605 family transposase [Streptomyces phaeochromogenes]|uniref:IS200/IS605 family transposase n=1 Tax=Streptomyces phaeochromogenes TaxID=1923 RepID=UPI00368E6370